MYAHNILSMAKFEIITTKTNPTTIEQNSYYCKLAPTVEPSFSSICKILIAFLRASNCLSFFDIHVSWWKEFDRLVLILWYLILQILCLGYKMIYMRTINIISFANFTGTRHKTIRNIYLNHSFSLRQEFLCVLLFWNESHMLQATLMKIFSNFCIHLFYSNCLTT